MSEHNDIDRLFQSHFNMHEVQVSDRDALWKRIQPNGNKRRMGFLLLFGFLIAGSSYHFLVPHHKASENQSLTSNILSSSISISTNQSQEEKLNTIQNLLDTQSSQLMFDEIEETETVKFNLENIANTTTPQFLQKDPTGAEISSKKALFDIAKQEDAKIESSISPTSKLTTNSSGNQTQALSLLVEEESFEILPAQVSNGTNTLIEASSKKAGELLSINKLLIAINQLSINSSAPSLDYNSIFKKDKNPLDDCIAGSQLGHWYIDLYTAIGQPLEQLVLNPGFEDQSQFLETWESRFETLPSISLGLAIGYELSSGLDIAVGVEYQKMQSQYKTIQNIREEVTVFDPMAFFFFDDNNEIVWVGDSVTAINTFDRTVSVANTYTMIHIPIQVSYPLLRKGPWNIKATAGATLNLSLQYRGQHLRSDLSLVQIDAANQGNYYNPEIGISLEGGAHIGHTLGTNWEVYLSPRFRYNQTSYLNQTQMLSLSRNYVSIRGGIQYHF